MNEQSEHTERTNLPRELDIMEILYALLNKIWLIALVAVISGVLAFLYTKFLVTPTYRSEGSLFIMAQNSDLSVSSVNMSNSLLADCEKLIKGRVVLETVIEDLDLNMSYNALKSIVSVSQVTNTHMIDIAVTHSDPAMAQKIVNAINKVAQDKIALLLRADFVSVTAEGNLPTSPSSPNVMKNVLLCVVIAVVVVCGVLVVAFILDDKIKTSEDVEKYLQLSTLGVIPIAKKMEREED